MKIELPDAAGGNIISLEVVRQARFVREMKKLCMHRRVVIDPTMANIVCKDCDKELNPVEWIAGLVEDWDRVHRLYEDYTKAKQALDERTRTKCRHCGQFTPVR